MGNLTRNIVFVLLLSSVGLIISCSSSRDVAAERAAARKDTLNAYEKEFDTSEYDVKEPKPTTERAAPRVKSSITAATETMMGFRVQVFQSTSIEQANQVKNDISLLLGDEEIYMHYDPPNYKVRVGDFSTRPDATQMVNLLAEKGYKDAWVVPDRVYKR